MIAFEAEASDWTDDDNDFPLSYVFATKVKDTAATLDGNVFKETVLSSEC